MCFHSSDWGGRCWLAGIRSRCSPTRTSSRSSGKAELDFVELGSEADYQSITEHPSLWKPIPGVTLIAEGLILRNMRRTIEIIEQKNVPGQTVIAAPLTAFGARIANERLGIPLVTVCLAAVGAAQCEAAAGHPAAAAFAAAAAQLGTSFCSGCRTGPSSTGSSAERPTHFAASSGSSRSAVSFMDWSFSPTRILGLFPEWFAPDGARLAVHACGCASSRCTTQAIPRRYRIRRPRSSMKARPPVVFTPGSAMRHASEFFAACVEACRIIGIRGVLISPFRDQLPRDLPPFIQVIDSIPFSRLFTRAAAIVHHGGIGTSSQALFAAVPQVIMPMAFDQHDNADRLERLGVARSISPRRFRGPALARVLGELLESPSVAASCRVGWRANAPARSACRSLSLDRTSRGRRDVINRCAIGVGRELSSQPNWIQLVFLRQHRDDDARTVFVGVLGRKDRFLGPRIRAELGGLDANLVITRGCSLSRPAGHQRKTFRPRRSSRWE